LIARRIDGGWSLIRQVDHAAHAGRIARAWRMGPYGAPSVSDALLEATGMHDLGWAEIDSAPELDAEGHPLNFTGIDEERHTRFYSAAVRTIARSNPYAAYLVSLHASGLYSGRYAWAGLKPVDWEEIGPRGRELLEGERRFRAELATTIAAPQLEFEGAWRDYMLLETFDYLSLLTCFGFDSDGCGPVPAWPGRWGRMSVRRLGPWEVELDPFPFEGADLVVEVDRVQLVGSVGTEEELRREFASAPRVSQRTVYLAPPG